MFDGVTNGERFQAYVTDILISVLKRGDTVILKILPSHKVAGISEGTEAAGVRLLYLPANSPDFNPFEQAFANPKARLRTAAASTVRDLWAAIPNAFAAFKLEKCQK